MPRSLEEYKRLSGIGTQYNEWVQPSSLAESVKSGVARTRIHRMANLLEDERFGGPLESIWDPEDLQLLAEAAEVSEPHAFAKAAVDHALELDRQAPAVHARGDHHQSMKHAEAQVAAHAKAAQHLGAIGDDEQAAKHDAAAEGARKVLAWYAHNLGNTHHSQHLKDPHSSEVVPTKVSAGSTPKHTQRSAGVTSKVLKSLSSAGSAIKSKLKSALHKRASVVPGAEPYSKSARTGAQSPMGKQQKKAAPSISVHGTAPVSGAKSKAAVSAATPVDHKEMSKRVNAMSARVHDAEDDPSKGHGLHAVAFKELHNWHSGAARAAIDAGDHELAIAHTHAALSALNKHFHHKKEADKEVAWHKAGAEAQVRHAERVAAGGGPRAGGGGRRPEGGFYGQTPPPAGYDRKAVHKALNRKHGRGR